MGNSASAAARGTLGVSTLAELGENEVQYEKSMGSSRFLKAVRARHTEGRIVVKTFVKPDGSLPLRHLFRRLKKERETLATVPNVLTYQQTRETDRAGYLIRQWVSSNLYDRISTRPFLTVVEKKWITYQLLSAMRASREKDVSRVEPAEPASCSRN
jgi:phosphoinositide-3-kinase regulatory subunit 4